MNPSLTFRGLVRAALTAFALASVTGPAAAADGPTTPQGQYVFGLSPFLDDAAKDAVYRGIVRLVLDDLPLNSSLRLYDAYRVQTIAEIEIPEVQAFRSAKTRAIQLKDRIQALRRFLATTPEKPQAPGVNFQNAVRLPQFMDFLAENLVRPGQPLVVVLLGSPLYLDEKEPAFSMVNGYFPSDGHLLADADRSVYGVKDRGRRLDGVGVLFGYFGDPWVSEVHQQKVSRFWSLFLHEQGAQLATFTGDLPTVFKAVRTWKPGEGDGAFPHALDRSQTKVEMLRITRDPGMADWITRDLSGQRRPGPPTTTVGPLKIGIRWQGALDLDLYARPQRDAETLYFRHTRSPEGYYFKDHRSSPEREYEFIEFVESVDVTQLQAFVNFYEGRMPGGVEGEVRVEFKGRIYPARFVLRADRGNQGRAGDGQEAAWTTLDIPTILGLPQPKQTARRP